MSMVLGLHDPAGAVVMGLDDAWTDVQPTGLVITGGAVKWRAMAPELWLLWGGSQFCWQQLCAYLDTFPLRMGGIADLLPPLQDAAQRLHEAWRADLPALCEARGVPMLSERAATSDMLLGGRDHASGQLALWRANSGEGFSWRPVIGDTLTICPEDDVGQHAYEVLKDAMTAGHHVRDAMITAIQSAHRMDARVGNHGRVFTLIDQPDWQESGECQF